VKSRIYAVIALSFSIIACDSGGERSASRVPEATGNFPQDVVVSSPFSFIEKGMLIDEQIIDKTQPFYTFSSIDIENARVGNIPPRFAFKPRILFYTTLPASCFTPIVKYQNHPHDIAPNSGEISSGELGLWQVLSSSSENVCSAEAINSGTFELSRHYRGIQMMFAGMIFIVENTVTLKQPELGETLDITRELNSAAGSFEDDNSIFNSGTVTHVSDGSWEYNIDLELVRNWGVSGIFTHNMQFSLTHRAVPEDQENQYSGLLNFRVSGNDMHFPGTNCPGGEARTYNGSVKYQRYTTDRVALQARSAIFCGDRVDGRITGLGEDKGMVDDDFSYSGSNNGWSESFKIFAADFDPNTQAGNYSYIFQANPDDANSQIFNVGVSASHPHIQAESYFGFGDPIATTDGTIQRFICNVNGPNGGLSLIDRSHIDRLQRQQFTYSVLTGVFNPSSVDSNILYAPTNSCNYDGAAPNGEFLYDTNGDGQIDDEIHQAINHQLWQGSPQNQLDGDTLPEIITQLGISIPQPPGGWPSEN